MFYYILSIENVSHVKFIHYVFFQSVKLHWKNKTLSHCWLIIKSNSFKHYFLLFCILNLEVINIKYFNTLKISKLLEPLFKLYLFFYDTSETQTMLSLSWQLHPPPASFPRPARGLSLSSRAAGCSPTDQERKLCSAIFWLTRKLLWPEPERSSVWGSGITGICLGCSGKLSGPCYQCPHI